MDGVTFKFNDIISLYKAGAIHGDIRREIRRADFAAVFVLSCYTQRIRVTDSLNIFAAIFKYLYHNFDIIQFRSY